MEEEIVVNHIRELLDCGKLEPGDRLPAERRLAEKLGISRAHIRSAYKKMEAYGIAKTYPQSGTVIVEENNKSLAVRMSGMLKIGRFDFASLAHVRHLLEEEAVTLAAKNRTPEDVVDMRAACAEAIAAAGTEHASEKDFDFHQAMARAGHNPVIVSLLLAITPDVLAYYQQHKLCSVPMEVTNNQHMALCDAIERGDAVLARTILKQHFKGMLSVSKK